jgi:hypothetical protein
MSVNCLGNILESSGSGAGSGTGSGSVALALALALHLGMCSIVVLVNVKSRKGICQLVLGFRCRGKEGRWPARAGLSWLACSSNRERRKGMASSR